MYLNREIYTSALSFTDGNILLWKRCTHCLDNFALVEHIGLRSSHGVSD